MALFSKKQQKKEAEENLEKKDKVVKDAKAEVKDKDGKDKKTSDKPTESKKAVKAVIAYKVLLRPLVSEKGADLAKQNKYLFEVAINANKIQIAEAVKEVYGEKVSDVNIIKMKGKKVRRGRVTGKRKDWKKAVVTLPKGKSIQIYEGV